MNRIKRKIEGKIDSRLKPNKVILLFGARRVGKTILMKEIVSRFNGNVLSLNGEDIDSQALLEKQSISNYSQLLKNIDLLAIDEAHNIPDIGKKLKLIVDEIPNIKVIASGSSSFDLHNKSGEPLVGRSSQFLLFPFSFSELSQTENALEIRQNQENRLIFGSYPDVVLNDDNAQKQEYLKEIVNSYLLKDILAIDGVKNSTKMRDLLRLIAFQIGNEVSYDELGKQLGLSRNTIEKYLDLLSKVFIVYKLKGFCKNMRKEISKSSKWYFFDNGIRNALIGNYNTLAFRNDIGQLWENYLISERIKRNQSEGNDKNLYFWRTYDGQEIDLIEETSDFVNAYEFKWGDKKCKAPRAFTDNYLNSKYTVINQENYIDFLT